MNNKSCSSYPCHLRNFKGFRSAVPGTGDKSKIFLTVSQYHRWGWSKLWMYNPHLIGNWVNCLICQIILERSWFRTSLLPLQLNPSPHAPKYLPGPCRLCVRKNSMFPDTHNIREKGGKTVAWLLLHNCNWKGFCQPEIGSWSPLLTFQTFIISEEPW